MAGKSKLRRKKTLLDWYLIANDTLKTAQEQLRDNPEADLKPLYRLIDDLMATVRSKGAEPFLLLSALGKALDPHLAHSINTAIICCALGDSHGLNSGQINTLCATAFLHDLGRLTIPTEWAQDVTPLSSEERAVAGQHCDWGFMLLLRQKQLAPQMAVAAAEHHEGSSHHGGENDTLLKILALADAYDLTRLTDRSVAAPSSRSFSTAHDQSARPALRCDAR